MNSEGTGVGQLWRDVRLATMDPARPEAYGGIVDGALVTRAGRIVWLGPEAQLPATFATDTELTQLAGNGAWMTPGLLDCHTHLVYAGNRVGEFEQRLQGVNYADIARRGGGIRATVSATRLARETQLLAMSARRLIPRLREGLTGIEIKSGYGLDCATEMKMLRVARKLAQQFPVDVSTSYLGAHTLPEEYENPDAYIDWLCDTALPAVAAEKLADAVDVFCESIGFSLAQCERVFQAAMALDLPVKAHVEQLSAMGGSALAARYRARSVDHLEYLDPAEVAQLRSAGTVAVLLPGAFYFLGETQLPPVAALREAGVPIAIASDCNPGSSPVGSLLLMLNMACTLFKLTPEEALAGVTRNAATALGWQQRCGMLCVGKQADLVLWDIEHPAELAYHIGANPCLKVVKNGAIVYTA